MFPNICNIWWEARLKLCHDILETTENGLDLASTSERNLDCQNVTGIIHLLTRSTIVSSTSSVFFCPQICYDDLETPRRVCLPNHIHAVSATLEHNSALILVRREWEPIWYIRSHVTDINFNRLESKSYSVTRDPAIEINDDHLIKLYVRARRITSSK